MPEQYSNHRDTPLRRFNTFWWGLAYFGLFGFVSVIVHIAADKPSDVEGLRKAGRMEMRKKVDADQSELMKGKEMSDVAEEAVKPEKPSDIKVPVAAPENGTDGPDVPEGQALYTKKTCNTCHGEDGNKTQLPMYPKLAGQNVEYLVAQTQHFATDKRTNNMSALMKATLGAQKVTDEEIKKIADWLSKLERPKVELADGKGKELYNAKLCATCHGPDGNTPLMPLYPRITGQNAQYLAEQMKAIKNGTRTNGQSAAMMGIMANVSDEEIQIIADWLSGKK